MRALVLVWGVMMVLPAAVNASERPIVAVFDLDVQGVAVEVEVRERLNQLLYGQLAASDAFQAVPRDQLRERLAKQKTSSFKACFDQSCQVTIGKELAAQKTLSSQIMRFGQTCTVMLTLFDLRRATTDFGVSLDGPCSAADLAATVKQAVAALARKQRPSPDPVTKPADAPVPKPTSSRCEIILPEQGCPANPNQPRKFDDTADTAPQDQRRCIQRAYEWFYACNNTQAVQGRYIEDGAVIQHEWVQPSTHCAITLPKTGCPANPGVPKQFKDHGNGAGTNQAQCMQRASDWFNYCAAQGGVRARYYAGTKLIEERLHEPKSRCEIGFSQEGCPYYPHTPRLFNEDTESSGSNQARCVQRAHDWYAYCKCTQAVEARYFEGGKLIQLERARPSTRCEVRLPEEGCQTKQMAYKVFDDNGEQCASRPKVCAKRAADWFHYCGVGGAVETRYYEGSKLVVQERYDPPSRCEIHLPEQGCPKVPANGRGFNDTADTSPTDPKRCMQRAKEWYDYCGNSQPVRARFYRKRVLVQERSYSP